MREIRLYDSLSGQLVPVTAGDAIRVEVRTAPISTERGVAVEATRPLVLFSFLERLLQREGFGTKFLFDSPGGTDMLYELAEGRPPADAGGNAGERGATGRRGGEQAADEYDDAAEQDAERDPERDAEMDAERDAEMSLFEVPRSDVDSWVNVCFGAERDGAERDGADWERAASSEPVVLTDALERYGHPAIALYLLGTHYSRPLGDAVVGLRTGARNAGRIREVLDTLTPGEPSPPDMCHYMDAFRDALANDLDTPAAFVILFEWVLEAERRGGEIGDNDLRVMLEVLELDDLAEPAGTR